MKKGILLHLGLLAPPGAGLEPEDHAGGVTRQCFLKQDARNLGIRPCGAAINLVAIMNLQCLLADADLSGDVVLRDAVCGKFLYHRTTRLCS
jgi:hypothetical protein